MRSRWFHAPLLHTADGEEKKVSWLELFYDLIFVASIIQLGDALSEDVSVKGFLSFAGHFVPLWLAWTGFTFYQNRFEVDDFIHRTLVFLKMFAVGAMAISAPEAMRGNPEVFSWSFAIVQAIVAFMYYRAYRHVPDARPYSRYWGMIFAVGALFWLVAGFVGTPYCYLLWAGGLGAMFTSPLSKQFRTLQDRYPGDMEHLGERYGLLTIIVLGESFVKVLSFLTTQGHGVELEYIAKGCLNLLITCCIWWIYFDDVAGSKLKKKKGGWEIWIYAHMPLTIAITAVGVAVKKALKFNFDAPADDAYRWLLVVSLALVLLSVAVIDSVTERRQSHLSDRARVNVRFGSAAVILLMGVTGAGMNSALFLGIVTSVCVAQVIFDMMMAPFEESDREGDKPLDIAEIARRKAAGDLSAHRAAPPPRLEAVIKGAPNELKRDLYFFFMEGSWTRFFAALAFLYLIVNVFFAGIYMLEPGSIYGAGPESFADAFAFSVQTMSTLGYGAMHPATAWADMAVTVEAAFGLFGVAMATGLMFSKVSRPQSSVLFSGIMTVTNRHGKPCLIFRAGNAKGHEIVEATMSLSVLVEEVTPEGDHLRRIHDLKLLRNRSPMFTLSWTLIHEIDDESPLRDVDWNDPRDHLILVIATMIGHDGTYGQTTFARHIYQPEEIMVGQRFVDVISQLEDGRLMVDLTKFHDTISEEATEEKPTPEKPTPEEEG